MFQALVEESLPFVIEDIKYTLNFLKENTNKLILIYPIPNHAQDTNEIILRNKLINDSLGYSKNIWIDRVAFSKEIYDSIKGDNIIRIYPEELFCEEFIPDTCVAKYGNQLFYNDGNHYPQQVLKVFVDFISKQIFNEK